MCKTEYSISTQARQSEILRATEYYNDKRSDRALRDINIAVWMVVGLLTVAVMFF